MQTGTPTKKMDKSNCTIIIRSSGERTVPALKVLMRQQVSENQIFGVQEVPLTMALKKCYEVAIKDNRDYLLILDGDVLPVPSMLQTMLQIFDELDERVFGLQCNVLDKMTQTYRPAGVHMHRTKLLKKAITLIPENRNTVRPESITIRNMEQAGHPTLFIDNALALHDYEQYYRDLARKGFFTAHKFSHMIPYLKKLWSKLSEKDHDFAVLLEGLKRGEAYDGLVVSNIEDFKKIGVAAFLSEKGIQEKQAIDVSQIDFNYIQQVFDEFSIPSEFWNFKLFSDPNTKGVSFKRRLNQLRGNLGLLKLTPWIFGNFMEKMGRGIKKRMEP